MLIIGYLLFIYFLAGLVAGVSRVLFVRPSSRTKQRRKALKTRRRRVSSDFADNW